MMNTIEGGVTAAKGFMAASAEAGIKYKNRTDGPCLYRKPGGLCRNFYNECSKGSTGLVG